MLTRDDWLTIATLVLFVLVAYVALLGPRDYAPLVSMVRGVGRGGVNGRH